MTLPRHIAMVMDGNRRWARRRGFGDPSVGHRYGAEHLEHLLTWCAELGIGCVTAYVASSDNLRKRDPAEVAGLMRLVETVVADRLSRPSSPWRLHVAGRLDELPDSTREALRRAVEATSAARFDLTVAIGYDGRQDIVDAVRTLLRQRARAGATLPDVEVTPEAIAAHLSTAGRPDPDVIIRTSGEVRLSGFLLWQSAHSELRFID